MELLGPGGWQLARVTVRGFGGIGNSALPVDLVGGAAVNLVRGDNGSGKTSLVAALEFALTAGRRLPGGGGATDLWRSERLSDGAAEGTVQVRLVRDTDRLTILATCPGSGVPTVDARLTTDGGDVPVELGDAWIEALTAANVCLTYAALQTRLRTSTDL